MTAIVAADRNFAIGNKGKLLLRVSADMKRFRAMTLSKVVILGRKTLETFPQGMPLDGRVNIIMSRNTGFKVKGAIVVHDLDELQKALEAYDAEDVFVIGGEQIYRLLLPMCDKCEVTFFDRIFEADAYFPNLDEDPCWMLNDESEEQTSFDTVYTYRTYIRKS